MRKTIFVYVMFGFLSILALGLVSSAELPNVFLDIDVEFYDNYNPTGAVKIADITSQIFVASFPNSLGRGSVRVPLTHNGKLIVDEDYESLVDYPGIVVVRKFDEQRGAYVALLAPGRNEGDSREVIEFDATFGRASIDRIENGGGENRYSDNGDFECGINRNNVAISDPENDEFRLRLNGKSLHLCSVTSDDSDKVIIFYTIEGIENLTEDDVQVVTPLEITNIELTPELQSEYDISNYTLQQFKLDFDSNIYPIETSIRVIRSDNLTFEIENNLSRAGQLPIEFSLPEGLLVGNYRIVLDSRSLVGGLSRNGVGRFAIVNMSGDNGNGGNGGNNNTNGTDNNGGNGGGSSNKKNSGVTRVVSQPRFVDNNNTLSNAQYEDYLASLKPKATVKESGFAVSGFLLAIIVLDVILVLALIVVVFLK